MREGRKPSIVTSGLPPQIAKALEPVKQSIEMMTGARAGISELKGLRGDESLQEICTKINEIIARINASGRA